VAASFSKKRRSDDSNLGGRWPEVELHIINTYALGEINCHQI
jgi:hypothetical protein